MRILLAITASLLASGAAWAQKPAPVTVPATIDHGRVVITIDVPTPDGSNERVRALVDSGNPGLELSRRLATTLGLKVVCGDTDCLTAPPKEVVVGGMSISLADVKQARIPLRPVNAASVLEIGTNVEINLPSTVLRHYDVLIDYPGRKVTLGPPGSIPFHGTAAKVQINADTGMVSVPSKIENKKYDLGLDLASPISFLSAAVYDSQAAAHADWPHMTGAVGPANVTGASEETTQKIMRVDRMQYGPLFLIDVPVVDLAKDKADLIVKRQGSPISGWLGAQVFQNYRVGFDYAHLTVYFEIGRLFTFPDFDVIGLELRPEYNGTFTIIGVADFNGKPAVEGVQPGDTLIAVDGIAVNGFTMGQVWSALRGTPGQQRKLTIERTGKQFIIAATVQPFLAAQADDSSSGKESRKKK